MVIVENGTLPTERAATTLRSLSDAIAQLGIAGPAVIFVDSLADAGLQRPEAVTVYRRARTGSRQAIAAQTAEVTL